ncbi:MAG TPA: S41 family peptidase [Candidatus Paceibacterota bacterium]|jgi:C-terminal processing protease CtpA/Prc|nr:S41 family peptidase [Candidatus Paceibacterota bacterium]
MENNNISLDDKIYGLSLIWKEAEYNFPFWKRLNNLDWDNAYRESLIKIMETKTIREYYLELCRFISLLRDGHTKVWFPIELKKEVGKLPIWISIVNDKWYITNKDSSLNISLYDEVIAINNISIQEYLSERIYPYCWHEKVDSLEWDVNSLIPFVEYKTDIVITTSKDSFTVKATNNEIKWNPKIKLSSREPLIEIFSSKTHKIFLTKDNIAIIIIPTFMEDSLKDEFYKNMDKLKDCSGYIVDIRDNGGGNSNNADSVVQAFLEGEFINSTDKKMIHIGTYKSWGKNMNLEKLNQNNELFKKVYDISKRQYYEYSSYKSFYEECPFSLKGTLIVLENQRTGSSAENMLVCLDSQKRAIIMGTPSCGSTGNPLSFDLPGGGGCRICTRWETYPDGREFINIGVIPHIRASLSIDDIRDRHDSVLDKAIYQMRKELQRN